MRLVFGLVLLVGLALAGSAVYLVKDYMRRNQAALDAERAKNASTIEVVDIYVAKIPLKNGHVLTPEDVQLIKFPKASQPEGAFLTEEELFPNGNANPRTVLRAIEVNEPLLSVKITEPGGDAGIQTVLTPGMRAHPINVSGAAAVAGLIFPGDRVEINWNGIKTIKQADGELREVPDTATVLSNVKIIAVNQSTNQDDRTPIRDPKIITVEVTPAQVKLLTEAGNKGALSFVALSTIDSANAGDLPETRVDLDYFGVSDAGPGNCVTQNRGRENEQTICR